MFIAKPIANEFVVVISEGKIHESVIEIYVPAFLLIDYSRPTLIRSYYLR